MHAADLLSKRAYLTPDREALLDAGSGRRYSYAELNARANRLANFLRDLGVQKGDRVSILAYNSVVYVDLLYGLAKIGAIFAPLNWRLTARELTYIINDCQPRVLIYNSEFETTLSEMRPNLGVSHYIKLNSAPGEGTLSYEFEMAHALRTRTRTPSPGRRNAILHLVYIRHDRAPERRHSASPPGTVELHQHGHQLGFERAGCLSTAYTHVPRRWIVRLPDAVAVCRWAHRGGPGF